MLVILLHAVSQAKIARALAAREHQQRKRNLVKYIPNTCSAIWNVLEGMADATDARAGGPKRRKLMLQQDILSKIKREEVRGVPRGGWVAGGVDVGMGINDAAQCVAAACVSETLFVEQLDGGFGVWVWVCVGWWVGGWGSRSPTVQLVMALSALQHAL